jgi:hypothetical protein
VASGGSGGTNATPAGLIRCWCAATAGTMEVRPLAGFAGVFCAIMAPGAAIIAASNAIRERLSEEYSMASWENG